MPRIKVPGADQITIERPDEVREGAVFNRLEGVPRKLELWIARGGAPPTRLATLNVRTNDLTLKPGDPNEPNEERWWSSFEKAKAVGLGAELDLGAGDPSDIDALYLIGLGDDAPDKLFQDHRDSGRLAILDAGSPTNTVEGQPAADLGQDPETWRDIVRSPAQGHVNAQRVSRALTGSDEAVTPLPGRDGDHGGIGRRMLTVLWPALWGHPFRDIWAWPGVQGAALWAFDNAYPQGPLPPIRIGRQPYGLLPTTSLSSWIPSSSAPDIEEKVIEKIADLRKRWAEEAEKDGNVVGADTDRLLQLTGRTGTSGGYIYRPSAPQEVMEAALAALNVELPPDAFEEAWQQASEAALQVTGGPVRRYMTLGLWMA